MEHIYNYKALTKAFVAVSAHTARLARESFDVEDGDLTVHALKTRLHYVRTTLRKLEEAKRFLEFKIWGDCTPEELEARDKAEEAPKDPGVQGDVR